MTRRVASIVAAALAFVAVATLDGQRPERRDANTWGDPVATTMLVQRPDAYYGRLVNLSVGVEVVLSRTAFIVDQRRVVAGALTPLGRPLLVVFPYAEKPMSPSAQLLVRGEVVPFSAEAVARVAPGYVVDIPADLQTSHRGKPVVVANLVMDSKATVLGRRPIPPPASIDLTMGASMRIVASSIAQLRSAVQARTQGAEMVATSARALELAFTDIEVLWDDLGQTAAAQWAREARAHAAETRAAAGRDDWNASRDSLARLNQSCGTCHGVYRDQLEDGTFRVRRSSF